MASFRKTRRHKSMPDAQLEQATPNKEKQELERTASGGICLAPVLEPPNKTRLIHKQPSCWIVINKGVSAGCIYVNIYIYTVLHVYLYVYIYCGSCFTNQDQDLTLPTQGNLEALKFKWHTQSGCPDICRR